MKDRAYEIARNPSCDGYHQRVLASMVYTFFHKKTGSRASVNEEIAEKISYTNNSKEEQSMWGLRIIFGQRILLKWDHYLLKWRC